MARTAGSRDFRQRSRRTANEMRNADLNARTEDAPQRTAMQNFMQHGTIRGPPAQNRPNDPNVNIATEAEHINGEETPVVVEIHEPAIVATLEAKCGPSILG